MEPCKVNVLNRQVQYDKELKDLAVQAYIAYGGYKHSLLTSKVKSKDHIEQLVLLECISSINMKEQLVDPKLLFYVNYSSQKDKVLLIKNTRKAFINSYKLVKEKTLIDKDILDEINKDLLTKISSKKDIGVYRGKNVYVTKMGLVGKTVDFMPIKKNYVSKAMEDYLLSFNELDKDYLVNMALQNYKLLTIHPYLFGNGRLSRILIPITLSYYLSEEPLLMISETLEKNKNTYFKFLNDARNDNVRPFVKFFLQMIIEQCSININRIDMINEIYDEDYEYCKEVVGGRLIKRFYPYMAKKVVFTIGDMTKDLKMHINSANKLVKRLIQNKIIVKSKDNDDKRVTYKYQKMYKVFIKEEKKETII